MALAPLDLADIQITLAIVDSDGRPAVFFQRLINQNNKNIKMAVEAIIENIAATAAAQAAADAAQDSAIAAQADAIAGLEAAAAAQATANNAVQKDFGPAWTSPSGTASRAALAAFTGVGPFTVSNPPTQAEVQAIGSALVTVSNALVAFSQAEVAVITDLIANGALT